MATVPAPKFPRKPATPGPKPPAAPRKREQRSPMSGDTMPIRVSEKNIGRMK